ncbi:MAG: BlaI/MecI/CopY family transcriptional regulator [Firmicutes bacterium]|nr:BlaI/MecI/CopY family transcriptional regulator [Bacillota bacterium]
MKKTKEISGAELEVMQILWKNNRPMKVQDVCDELENNKWEYRTVATLLIRMREKGAVECVKKQKVNYYTPVLDKESYTKSQTKTFIQKLYNGSVKDLAVSLFKSEEMSKEDIEEIRKMFDL